jgi:UPF0755 protein
MKNDKNRLPAIICLIGIACVICIAAFFAAVFAPVSPGAKDVLFTVQSGSSATAIAEELSQAGLVRSALGVRLYARAAGLSLKAGTYRLSAAMWSPAILSILAEGRQEYTRVTIPEGLSLLKTAEHLESAGVVRATDFIAAARHPGVLEEYGLTGVTAEGFLFPDTYFFPVGADAGSVVGMMVKTFFDRVSALPGLPQKPEGLYRKVILASIIEREYRVPEEAPIIASVFANRLAIGMGLQSCATIEYIITEIQGRPHPKRLSLDDLEIDSEYNTYRWAGLPPGPIASPGLVALGAAFAPADTRYLYFRLTDPERGTHSFTRSLEEHVRAGRQLDLKRAAGN